jgi:hypothetical protein
MIICLQLCDSNGGTEAKPDDTTLRKMENATLQPCRFFSNPVLLHSVTLSMQVYGEFLQCPEPRHTHGSQPHDSICGARISECTK